METWTVTLTSCITHGQVFGQESGLATTRSMRGSCGGLLAKAKAQAVPRGIDEEAAAREAADIIAREAAARKASAREAATREAAARDAATREATDEPP
jgi:hypothetical protein